MLPERGLGLFSFDFLVFTLSPRLPFAAKKKKPPPFPTREIPFFLILLDLSPLFAVCVQNHN